MKNKQEIGQYNFLEEGFERGACIFNKDYTCTHYWAVWTMRQCGDGDCYRKCCKGCKEMCGYRCNAVNKL